MPRRDTVGSQNGTQATFTIPVDRGTIQGKDARFQIFAHTPHYTYVAYGRSGIVLYVGLSSDPLKRLREHRKASPWFAECERVECFRHENRPIAARDEWRLIKELQPTYNTVGMQPPAPPVPVDPFYDRLRHVYGTTYDDLYPQYSSKDDAA